MIKTNLFPGGVRRALTLSYDDGQIFDVRLASLFDKYHMKATFHLNSGNLGKEGYVKENVLSQLYRRHEVSVHTVTHPFPTQIPDAELRREIVEDKRRLEELCGYPVRGMSYPFGDYSEHAICVARSCGMEYSRTVEDTGRFAIPQDFMKWHPTTHHDGDLEGLWKRFMERDFEEMLLFYVWGHSFEFDRENTWDKMEAFCQMAADNENVWYATNIEIKDYITAVRGLVYSEDGKMIYNPSCQSVWLTVDGEPVCIPAGALWKK